MHSFSRRTLKPFGSTLPEQQPARPPRLNRGPHVALTVGLLSVGTVLGAVLGAAPKLNAQPVRAVTRPAGPAQGPPLAAQFMYLDATSSGTRLVTPDGSITIGQPSDHFSNVLQFSEVYAIVAGTRATEDGRRLVLVESRLGSEGKRIQIELPRPQALSRLSQTSPQLFGPANDGARLSAAWFEGDNPTSNEVWTADLTAEGFTRPRRLATEGPGSQVALQGTTLSNGEQLLLWSAFDGEDSEIVWVHRQPDVQENGGWSQAQRLYPNNTVPDITPSVVAVGNQALAAWSWFDGTTYRLMLSRFNGTTWSAPKPVSAEAGIFPRFQQRNFRQRNSQEEAFQRETTRPILSFRTVSPGRWVYRKLDMSGETVGEVLVLSDQAQRPTVLAADSMNLLLTRQVAGPAAERLVASASSQATVAEAQNATITPSQTFSWLQP